MHALHMRDAIGGDRARQQRDDLRKVGASSGPGLKRPFAEQDVRGSALLQDSGMSHVAATYDASHGVVSCVAFDAARAKCVHVVDVGTDIADFGRWWYFLI